MNAAGVIHAIEDGLHTRLDVDTPVGHGARQVQARTHEHVLVGHAVLSSDRRGSAEGEEAQNSDQNSTLAEKVFHVSPPCMVLALPLPEIRAADLVVSQETLTVAGQRDGSGFQHVAVVGY